jgi:putative ABC transport system permease protein
MTMRELWTRLVDSLRRRTLERDLDEELRFHRQQIERAEVDAGASAVDARIAARRRLGDLGRITEASRERWMIRWIDHSWRDLRHATRALVRTPGFAVVAVGTLGFGLALAVIVTAVVNAYILRGLPYPASDRLFTVELQPATPGAAFPGGLEKLDWASLDDLVELRVAWDLDGFTIRGGTHPEAANGAWITPAFTAAYGITPLLGPGIQPADFEPGRPLVAVISYGLWQRRFGGDPQILGQRFDAFVNDRPDSAESFTIVGVLPEAFWHTNRYTDVLAPLRAPTFPYVMRLREGASATAVDDRMQRLLGGVSDPAAAQWRFQLRSMHDAYVATIRPLLVSVATATALVLLIACANVAVLMLVRATERRREMAMRKAIGASPAQLVRSVLAETAVIAIAATAMATLLASATLGAMAPLMERQLGRSIPGGAGALEFSWVLVAGTIAGGLTMTLACSLAPLWSAARAPVALALHASARTAGGGVAQRRARMFLIAGEVAACLTLLVGASLAVRSGVRILEVPFGLDPRDVLVGNLTLRSRAYPDVASRVRFYEQLESDAGRSGLSLALGNFWPLQTPASREFEIIGAERQTSRAGVMGVSAGYFATLGVEVLDGRGFERGDTATAPRVAVVSQTLARRLAPDGRAIGAQLRMIVPTTSTSTPPPPVLTVVGVVEDTRQSHADVDVADVYVALMQQPLLSAFVYARGASGLAVTERHLRDVVATADPEVAVASPRSLADIVDQQRAGTRFLATLLAVFSGFAALLALVGLYGVIAYAVRQREREIAVRLAIGADRSAITRLFLAQGARVLAAGLAIGVAGAIWIGRVLETQLFGIAASDPVSLWTTTAAFTVCGLLAIALPARAAAGADPVAALKE